MASLEEYIQGLDPETLDQIKRDLPLRIKSLAPEDRKAVMERLGNFYEFQDLASPSPQQSYQQPAQNPQGDIPLWQKGLNAFGWPFQQAEQKIIKPFWSAALSPLTPSIPGTEGMPWLDRERAEYEAWKAPQAKLGFDYPFGMGPATIGVKGALEMAPWFFVPGLGAVGKAGKAAGTAGQILKRGTLLGGKLASGDPWGIAGALGQAGPAARVAGRVVENLPWALGERGAFAATEAVGKGIRTALPGTKRAIAETAFKTRLAETMGAAEGGVGKGKAKLTDAELLEQAVKGAAPVAKEPWQMTQKQYVGELVSTQDIQAMETRGLSSGQIKYELEQAKQARQIGITDHKATIKQALAEGKPVPSSVLADYPDLAKGVAQPAVPTVPDAFTSHVKGVIFDKRKTGEVGNRAAVFNVADRRIYLDPTRSMDDIKHDFAHELIHAAVNSEDESGPRLFGRFKKLAESLGQGNITEERMANNYADFVTGGVAFKDTTSPMYQFFEKELGGVEIPVSRVVQPAVTWDAAAGKKYRMDIVSNVRGMTGKTRTDQVLVTPVGDYVVGTQPAQYGFGGEVAYAIWDKTGKLVKGGFEKHTEAMDAARKIGVPAAPVVEPAAALALPHKLSGEKSRYNIGRTSYIPEFSNDVDRALFIIAQTTKSKRDADYLAWLRGIFTDLDDNTLRRMGAHVKQQVKLAATKQPKGGNLKIESQFGQAALPTPIRRVAPTVEPTAIENLLAQWKAETDPTVKKQLEQQLLAQYRIAAQKLPQLAAKIPPATPPTVAGGGRPPRKPLWAGFEEPPQQPPEGPITTPSATPSGRVPGGIHRQTPYTSPDPYTQLQEALTPTRVPVGDKVSAGLNKVLPEMYDRNYLLKEVERVTGIPAHKAAQVVSGAVAAGEDDIRRRIRPILNSVANDIPGLEEYLTLQRLMDVTAKHPTALLPRNMRGMEAVINAQKTLAGKLGPERFAAIKAAAEVYWKEINDLTIGLLRKEGMIDDAEFLRLKTSNPHYIPLNRSDFSAVDDIARYMGVPEASIGATGLRRMGDLGSVRDLDNPLARGIAQVIRTRQAVARKQAATTILQSLQEYEQKTGEKMIRFLSPGQKGEHSALTDTISTFIEGKRVTAQVRREYAVIAKGLDAEVAGFWGKLLSVTAAPLRYGATTYNPAFLVVNPIRDALTAFFREGVIPLSPDYIKGWVSAIFKDATFSEAAQAGELMSGLVERMRSTAAVARQASRGAVPLKDWKDALLLLPRLVEWGNVTGERATRLATHIKLTRQGITGLERAVRVRDSTVDFSKMGNTMKVINQAIPFFNAGIQGAANVGRTIRDKPIWALKASTPFAAVSIMAWVNNKRFESSDKIPSYEYYNNWVLQVGEGTEKVDPNDPYKEPEVFPIYLKIPKGPMGAVLTSAPELLLRLAWGMNNRSVLDEVMAAGKGATDALLPIEPSLGGILPPLLGTAVQMQTGQDIYRGAPIVPGREERLPPEQQFGADTSTLAVELGQKFKVSPRLIDFAIRDYTAGTGNTLSWLASMGLEALQGRPEPYGGAFLTEPSREQKIGKTPIVSRFVGVRGTGIETAQRKEFGRLVKENQQTFRRFPDVNRLGISFGEVGDTIMEVQLEIPERLEYQRLAAQFAMRDLATVFDSSDYSKLSDAQKKELILRVMSKARANARDTLIPKLSETLQIRYELGQHGASLNKLEELTGERWNSPSNIQRLKEALSVLRPYWQLDTMAWGQYPPEYRQVYDQWRMMEKYDSREAKRFLFQYPQVAFAIKQIARIKGQQMRQFGIPLAQARELLFD